MAVQRVEKLLADVAKALDAANVPYGIVGGNAVAAWVATVDDGAVRATKDVDVLVRRPDLSAADKALRPLGLMPIEVLGVKMFVDRDHPNPKTGVHVVIANELIRPHYTHPAPDPDQTVRAAAGYLIVDLPALLRMKLQSYRRIDQVHVEDMLSVKLITEDVTADLPPDLRKRLEEIQTTME